MHADRAPIDHAHQPEPTATAAPEWRQVIDRRLAALCKEHFETTAAPTRRVSQLGREVQDLATIRAWFETGGNITRAAERLGTSRRAVRERVVKWRRSYPHLAPCPVAASMQPREPAEPSGPPMPQGEASRP